MRSTSCPSCGAPLHVDPEATIVRCGFCGRELERDVEGYRERFAAPAASGAPTRTIAIVTLSLIALGAAVVLTMKGSSPAPRPQVVATVVAPTPVETAAAIAPTPPPEAPKPSESVAVAAADIEKGPVTVTWRGKVVSSTDGPPVGAACTLTATLVANGTDNVDENGLVFQCGGKVLYDMNDGLEGMSSWSSAIGEDPVAGEVGVFQYWTKTSDTGPRSGKRTQIAIDTNAGVVEAFSDSLPTFRVKASIDALSSTRKGLPMKASNTPPFDHVVRRKAKATKTTGAPPFTASACDLVVSPADKKDHSCRARITCGGKIVFGVGSTGFEKCAVVDGEPVSLVDAYPTPSDHDPELNLDLAAGIATLADTTPSGASSWSIDFKLEK